MIHLQFLHSLAGPNNLFSKLPTIYRNVCTVLLTQSFEKLNLNLGYEFGGISTALFTSSGEVSFSQNHLYN